MFYSGILKHVDDDVRHLLLRHGCTPRLLW
jgi:hypothetical protein